jgi:aminopeptidase N
LRSIHSDDALEALLASTKQPDARVRRQVVSDIGSFYRQTAHASARSVLEAEKNPAILAVAIENLAAYAKPETQATLLKFLDSESFRNELAVAAIDAMRSQDDPAYIAPLLASLTKREGAFTSRGFAQALGTLGYLARNEDQKDAVREFLLTHVNSKKRAVQLASINALGALGDPKAIAVLQTFAASPRESRERTAAARAVTDLRAARRPVDDFKNLRQEVLDLQKSDRDLRKELDDLRRKLEARAKSAATPTPGPSAKKKKKATPVTSPRGQGD